MFYVPVNWNTYCVFISLRNWNPLLLYIICALSKVMDVIFSCKATFTCFNNWLKLSIDLSFNWAELSINLIPQSTWFLNNLDSLAILNHQLTWPINVSCKSTWFVSFVTCKTFCPFVLQCVVDVVFILKCRNVHVFH